MDGVLTALLSGALATGGVAAIRMLSSWFQSRQAEDAPNKRVEVSITGPDGDNIALNVASDDPDALERAILDIIRSRTAPENPPRHEPDPDLTEFS